MDPVDGSIEILQIEVGLLQNFVEIIISPETRSCVLCDPAFEVDRLYRLIAARGLSVAAVLLTHGHPDHIEGVPEVLARSGADTPVHIGAGEAAAVEALCMQARITPCLRPLLGGEVLRFGAVQVQVLPTPGHTAAGVSYYLPDVDAVLTGDTLFVGGCGRTNFPGSDARALFRSLQALAALPEQTRVYPGHDYGPTATSTLAWELLHNPCLRLDERAFLRRR
jgi:glyoxylase-like metal-dependent hydrolase (beta-lactamase superfamily II)